MNINTIIFDLGGVVIDLDEQASVTAFSEISNLSESEIFQAFYQNPIFQMYEKGLISPADFRNGIRLMLEQPVTDNQIDHAWNAMLGVIPVARLNLLSELSENYKVVILSNTNSIHIEAFNKILLFSSGKNDLYDFADYVFFSHELHMRKPDREIFDKALELSRSNADQTIFLDDKKENLQGAESAGIHILHITHPDLIFTIKQHV